VKESSQHSVREWMVLHPLDPFYRIGSQSAFSEFLVDLEFLAAPLPGGAKGNGFLPGPRFMQKLVFTGCSPSVGTVSQDVIYNQYDIEIAVSGVEPMLVTGTRNRAPMCPRCKVISDKKLIESRIIVDERISWLCPECNTRVPVEEIHWGRKACIATSTVVINGVHEGEVVPSDELLTDLHRYSGVAWSYCYCRGQS
jgi:hypothetical protein